MSGEKQYTLSLVVRAVDKASTTLKAFSAKMKALDLEKVKPTGSIFGGLSKFSGFDKLSSGVSGFGGALKNVGSEAFALGSQLVAMGAVAAIAFVTIIRGAAESGAQLEMMAKRAGMGVDAYASLQYAAGQAEIDQDAFNTAMDKFNKNMGAAKANGGPLLEFLQKVSPKLAEQFKGAKSSEEGLSLMTDAFVRLQDPSKRAILATEAFGKSGAQMGEFLHQGSGKIQEAQLKFLQLAGSQEEFAAGGAELNKAMKDTETAFTGLRNVAAGALFPALTSLTKVVTDFIVSNRAGIQKWAEGAAAAIQKWVDSGGFERLIGNLKDVFSTIGDALELVGGFKGALVVLGAVMAGPLLGALGALVPAVYALGVAMLTTPIGWIVLGLGAIAFAGYRLYKNWDLIKVALAEAFDGFLNISEGIGHIIVGLATFDLSEIISGWTEAVSGFQESLVSVLSLIDLIPGGAGLASFALSTPGVTPLLGAVLGAGSNGPNQSFGGPAGNFSTASGAPGSATVNVKFENLPRGARVSQDKDNSTPVDLDLGYSTVAP